MDFFLCCPKVLDKYSGFGANLETSLFDNEFWISLGYRG